MECPPPTGHRPGADDAESPVMDDPALSDRGQTSGPPAVPLPPPAPRSEEDVRAAAEAARRRDPTAATGQAG
jgi:hypothetical protein